MAHSPLRVGLIGAGGNTRAKHIPGLRALPGVEITAVCNRRPESTAAAAREFGVPRTFERWEDLVADPDIDAVVIGAWPYLHCPATLACLAAGKHVLTEVRMACNAAEALQMLEASRKHPDLIAQVVPSPYGLKGDAVVRDLVASGFLGELREVQVYSFGGVLADPATPLSWRQDAALSGVNMLNLGILHEALMRGCRRRCACWPRRTPSRRRASTHRAVFGDRWKRRTACRCWLFWKAAPVPSTNSAARRRSDRGRASVSTAPTACFTMTSPRVS